MAENGEFDACNTEQAHHNNEGIPDVGQGCVTSQPSDSQLGQYGRDFSPLSGYTCFCEKLKRHC